MIFGDLDLEDLCAEVYFKDQFVARITQETGFENLEIELYPPLDAKFWVFKFTEFDEAIQYAKKRLWDLRKLPENTQGQKVLDDILTDPKGFNMPNDIGGYDYFKQNRSGVRFYSNGEYKGFLEPPR